MSEHKWAVSSPVIVKLSEKVPYPNIQTLNGKCQSFKSM